MDQKKEESLKEAYDTFMELMLYDFPLDHIHEIIDEHVTGYGTTKDERILDIAGLRKLVVDQRTQGAGIEFQYEINPVHRLIMAGENTAQFVDEVTIIMMMDGNTNKIPLRLSTLFEFKETTWKVVHIHGSVAAETEEDTWHLNEWQQKNAELQKLVDEKTAELTKQNRELEIEAALERVRTRTMAMNKSEELSVAATVLFRQLRALGGNLWSAGFVLLDADREVGEFRMSNPEGEIQLPIFIPNTKDPATKNMYTNWKKGSDYYTEEAGGNDLKKHYDYLLSLPEARPAFQALLDAGIVFPNWQQWHAVYFSGGYLLVITLEPFENISMLRRFANVFEQTYTRFLDLQKAEAQAREAQIEAALERVRSRTMGMQHSNELTSTASLLFQQIETLGVPPWSCGFNIWEQGDAVCTSYMGGGSEKFILEGYKIPLTEEAAFIHFQESRDRGDTLFIDVLEGERLEAHYEYFMTLPGIREVFEKAAQEGLSLPTFQINHLANFKHGNLMFITYEPCPEAHDIFIRFAKVFEQTYTRFLDLQKAEAQAREAQIEAALEKVRSRTMAMQNSTELAETSIDMFKQMQVLGMRPWACGFNIFEKDERAVTQWMTGGDGGLSTPFITPLTEAPFFIRISEARQRGVELFVMESGGHELEETYKYMFNLPASKKALGDIMAAGFEMPKFQISHCAFFSQGYLMFITYEPCPEAHDIFIRFAKVFEQTYTRFLDLQKAEAQTREAQIEASLERVRSRSMAMHKSDELSQVVALIYEEIKNLGFTDWGCSIIICDKKAKVMRYWYAETNVPHLEGYCNVPLTNKIVKKTWKLWQSGIPQFDINLLGKEKEDYTSFMLNDTDYSHILSEEVKKGWRKPKDIFLSYFALKYGMLEFVDIKPLNPENYQVYQRFTKVFEQTYTRFLDLQKAEAQAREAKIEAALERVRSRSMAMHQSNELNEVATVLFQQIRNLGGNLWTCGIVLCQKDSEVDHFMVALENGMAPTIDIPNTKDPATKNMYNYWKKGADYYVEEAGGKDLKKHYDYLETLPTMKPVIENLYASGISLPTWQKWHAAYFTHGYVLIITLEPYPQEEVFKRFAKVFEQAYTRFLDLKKVEAQAREAQIEAALERVRSRTMGMQKSEELTEVIAKIHTEIANLGVRSDNTGIVTDIRFNDKLGSYCMWYSIPGKTYSNKFFLPDLNDLIYENLYVAHKKKKEFYTERFSKEEKNNFLKIAFKDSDLRLLPDSRKKTLLDAPAWTRTVILQNNSGLILQRFDDEVFSDEENAVALRFGRVLEQTYTRFLDLQKAEALAREAQIEAALERIRSKALAMQNSGDLLGVSNVLREQMGFLGQQELESSIVHLYNSTEVMEAWYTFRSTETNSTKVVTDKAIIPIDSCDYIKETYKKYKSKETEYTIVSKGKKLLDWYNVMVKVAPDTIEYDNQGKMLVPKILYYHYSNFSGGSLLMISNQQPSEESKELQRRAAKVFNLAYQRFLDLQQSEERTLIAVREASLDRVRAEIASMRHADDLQRITPLIWRELLALGVPFFRCGVMIMDEKTGMVQFYLTTPEGKSLAALNIGFDNMEIAVNAVDHWRHQLVYIENWDKEQFIASMKNLMAQGQIKTAESYQGGVEPPESLTLQFVPFPQGMLYVGSAEPLIGVQIELVKALSEAFSAAYARYEDFRRLEEAKARVEETLKDLRATQTQLVQSEKMASLGELTAGIAHEIQNPLNFVNNFSEVSEELLMELKEELEKGEIGEAKILSDDVIQNLQKIHHHGNRASEIVKSMLQHSRSSSGQKEPTDINALADEYLRLAYHGLRAKDKSFNADFKTNFDPALPKVEVIPQDIGRVLLNLINNAFFAVSQKLKAESIDFKPEVIVTTKKLLDSIEIRVKDNGSGIPDEIKEKIFQPFFTTKPTGSGTGLGLSLSYDIVKAHGGEIKVDSTENIGTEFIITLPITL